MTNTKAIIILFRAFFLTQCKFFKKHETVWTIVYGVIASLIIGIKNYMLYLTLIILLFTPLDHWVHNKLFEKSKLKDQATN